MSRSDRAESVAARALETIESVPGCLTAASGYGIEHATHAPAHSLRRGRLQTYPPEPVAVRRQDPLPAPPGGGALRLSDPSAPVRQVAVGCCRYPCWRTTTTASGRTTSTPPSPALTSARTRPGNRATTSPCASTSRRSTTSSKPWSGSSRPTASLSSGERWSGIPTYFPKRRGSASWRRPPSPPS